MHLFILAGKGDWMPKNTHVNGIGGAISVTAHGIGIQCLKSIPIISVLYIIFFFTQVPDQ